MPASNLWSLAQRWFAGRLAADWKPRTVAQSQQLLADAGFAGPFWQLKVEGHAALTNATLRGHLGSA